MISKSISALALLAALSVSTAQAEERFPAGGISLDPKVDVTIAKQDVYLSIRQVRVHYDYQSDSAQTVTMRFENPIVPLDQGPDHMGGAMLGEGEPVVNYTRLTITANGKPVEPVAREYAFYMGQDITAELLALGVDPWVSDEAEMTQVFGHVDAAKVKDLIDRGILVATEDGVPVMAAWSYQSVLEWEQPLAAGTTALDIAYQPLNGYPDGADAAYYGEGEDKAFAQQVKDFYCLDDSLFRAVKKKMDTGSYFELVELGFAMSQEDRARQIGEFNLIVDKADTAEGFGGPLNFVAFCPVDSKKINDTQFQWSAKDFTPSRDIDVVYYGFDDRVTG